MMQPTLDDLQSAVNGMRGELSGLTRTIRILVEHSTPRAKDALRADLVANGMHNKVTANQQLSDAEASLLNFEQMLAAVLSK